MVLPFNLLIWRETSALNNIHNINCMSSITNCSSKRTRVIHIPRTVESTQSTATGTSVQAGKLKTVKIIVEWTILMQPEISMAVNALTVRLLWVFGYCGLTYSSIWSILNPSIWSLLYTPNSSILYFSIWFLLYSSIWSVLFNLTFSILLNLICTLQ